MALNVAFVKVKRPGHTGIVTFSSDSNFFLIESVLLADSLAGKSAQIFSIRFNFEFDPQNFHCWALTSLNGADH